MRYVSSTLLLCIAALLAGCDTFYHDTRYQDPARQEAIRTEMARQQQARELDALKALGETAEFRLQQFEGRLDRLESAVREAPPVQGDIEALRRDVEQLRTSQANLRREIVDDLGREISKILAQQQQPARGTTARSGRQTGFEHQVQAGQTLSEIASFYKVKIDTIKQANNLKSDTIRIGQTLFIPD